MAEVSYFSEIASEDLLVIYIQYLNDLFVDPNTVLLVPFEPVNAIYFIYRGSVDVYVEGVDDAEPEEDIT